jgi:hypothetical protein
MGAGVDIDGSERPAFAMRSRVNWAVLGLLIERPGHGYDLFQRFQRTYGSLIELTHQRPIGKALQALEKLGLIEALPPEVCPGRGSTTSKPRYRARAEAVPAYREWLIAQVTQERQVLQLLALQVGALPPRDALVVVDHYERHLLSTRVEAPPAFDRASVLARDLAEQAKQLETGVALRWTTYARRMLEAAIEAQGDQTGAEPALALSLARGASLAAAAQPGTGPEPERAAGTEAEQASGR